MLTRFLVQTLITAIVAAIVMSFTGTPGPPWVFAAGVAGIGVTTAAARPLFLCTPYTVTQVGMASMIAIVTSIAFLLAEPMAVTTFHSLGSALVGIAVVTAASWVVAVIPLSDDDEAPLPW
jgi:hypothetical protein